MPPTPKISREEILSAAFTLVRTQGIDALGARALANTLHLSTQPIFSHFPTMDALKQAVYELAQKAYQNALEQAVEAARLAHTPLYKATGLAYLKVEDTLTGSIAKNLSIEEITNLKKELNLEKNDIIFFISGKEKIVKTSLGALRCKLANDNNLINEEDYKLLFVTDFPVFEYSEQENRYVACHHPFTAPKDEDIDKLLTDKANCYAKAYDIVINGYEAGGGSIRIHNQDTQKIMFEALGLSDEEAKNKFGFLMEAFKYGTPPHGGFALGLDRLTMLLTNTNNIRDVIAFPKTASASCLLTEAPNTVSKKQLEELGLYLKEESHEKQN